MSKVTLTGALTWNSKERRSDRYGGIGLQEFAANVNNGESSPDVDLSALKPLIGKRVQIVAVVIKSNDSCHFGDWFRGISPSRTPEGTEVCLGIGTLLDVEDDNLKSLIFRRDERAEERFDWIDPNQLYRLHDHIVELTVREVPGSLQ